MFAVLYKFGLQCAVGADALSDSFKLIRIGTHVGLSPSALRTQLGNDGSYLANSEHER